MTTPIPSASELHAYCFQLIEKAHADQRTPWRCWTVDEGAELLQLLAMRNVYGERWPRLLQSGAKVARQGWQSYVAVMADMVEAHHDQVCALVDNNPEPEQRRGGEGDNHDGATALEPAPARKWTRHHQGHRHEQGQHVELEARTGQEEDGQWHQQPVAQQ